MPPRDFAPNYTTEMNRRGLALPVRPWQDVETFSVDGNDFLVHPYKSHWLLTPDYVSLIARVAKQVLLYRLLCKGM